MSNLIVESSGFFQCDGVGKCGGTNFINKDAVMVCFHCLHCASFKRTGLRIKDNRKQLAPISEDYF